MQKVFFIFIGIGILGVIYSVDSVQNVYVQDLNLLTDNTNNFTNVAAHEVRVIPSNCTLALEDFTNKITELTRCTIVNARPIRVCVNCEKDIKDTQQTYDKLRAEPSVCQKFYFESDQIGNIDLIYAQGEAVWSKNNCKNCYDHHNDTVQFFSISRQFDACVKNTNKSSLVIGVNNTCDSCHELFSQLNDLYNLFVHEVGTYDVGGVCMDIVDQMNITRRFWNTQQCITFSSNIGYPNIVTAVLVGAMPVFFYMLSKNVSIIEDVKLVRPKRKGFSSVPSSQ